MENFDYQFEFGPVMDYLNHRFTLVIKDDDWNEEQLRLLKIQGMDLSLGEVEGVLFFLVEGGALDSADFYFNPRFSDARDELLEDIEKNGNAEIDVILIDENNTIKAKRSATLDDKATDVLNTLILKQMGSALEEEKYNELVDSIQNRFEPFELAEYALSATRI